MDRHDHKHNKKHVTEHHHKHGREEEAPAHHANEHHYPGQPIYQESDPAENAEHADARAKEKDGRKDRKEHHKHK